MSDYRLLKVSSEAIQKLEKFEVPENLLFGTCIAPIMAVCHYDNGEWGPLEMQPYGPLSIDPCMKVLHYGQEIFEGMKAYNCTGNGPNLFRPDRNYQRFNHSARVMAMPEVPADIFSEAVRGITAYMAPFIPNESETSLYIRPFMFASEVSLGIKPADQFIFMVVASPCGPYFTSESVNVSIERESVRAVEGGTGHAKTGGNYARGLNAALRGKEVGFHQTLWLDAKTRTNIEELSGMNFFAVIDGELHTPKLTDTILEGITRDSILTISSQLGLKAVERDMPITELIEYIQSGKATEAFACGTASIITPIAMLGELDGPKYEFKFAYGEITKKIRKTLLDIQEGRRPGPEGWFVPIDPIQLSNAG